MGKYSDPNAACATTVVKDRDGKLGPCGHFIADHAWNDPLAKQKDESDVDYVRRYNKAQEPEDKGGMKADEKQKREEASLDRGACHAYTGYQNPTCQCKSYTDPMAAEADKQAAMRAQLEKAKSEQDAAIKAAVAAALAEERAKVAASTPTPAAPAAPAAPAPTTPAGTGGNP